MAFGAQEEEEPDESGCEEEEGHEDEDEDSGSDESLVDSDSDNEGKGACDHRGPRGTQGTSWLAEPEPDAPGVGIGPRGVRSQTQWLSGAQSLGCEIKGHSSSAAGTRGRRLPAGL